MNLSVGHLLGMFLTLTGVVALGVWSGRQVKSAADFATGGGRAGLLMLTGSLMGALVGGACTIGTTQLGYTNGFSAIWFTAGLSVGCILFALFFVKPLRRSGCTTIQGMIALEYGSLSGFITSTVGIVSLLLSVISQMLSATALLGSLFSLSLFVCAVLGIALVMAYVLFGGLLGAGRIGIVKMVLISLAGIGGGLLALSLSGGVSALAAALPSGQAYGPFSRGFSIDGGAGISSVLGFLSTQTYVQCILSGRDDRVAVRGPIIAAIIIPPIGIGSVLIGLYMRVAAPGLDPAQAFPVFVLQNLPPVAAGVVLATLLLAIVGATSGLMLGVGTIVSTDIYAQARPRATDAQRLAASRIAIVVGLLVSLLFVCTLEGAILHWSFLSMGIRSSLTFLPLMGALFFPGRFDRRFMLASIILGPCAVLVTSLLPGITCDPIFPGMIFALLPAALGYRRPTPR